MTSFQRDGLRRGLTFSGRRPRSANPFESTYQFGVQEKRSNKGKLVKAGKLRRTGSAEHKKPTVVTWNDLYKSREANYIHPTRPRAKESPKTLLKQYDVRSGANFHEAFQLVHSPKRPYKSASSSPQVTKFPTRTVQRKTAHASSRVNHTSHGVQSLQTWQLGKTTTKRPNINVLGFTVTEPDYDDKLSEEEDDRSLLRISQCSPKKKLAGSTNKTNPLKTPISYTKKPEPRISDLIKSKRSKTGIRNKCTSLTDQPRRAAWIRKHKHNNRTVKPGVWSKDMHKFHMHTPAHNRMHASQSDFWDPNADPEALGERGFGIGQWKLQDHFQNRQNYAHRMKLGPEEEMLLAKANSVQRTRSNRSDAQKGSFTLVVGVPSAQSSNIPAWDDK